MEKIVTEWYESIYDVAESAQKKGVVLCGDGKWAKYAVEILALFDVSPRCICRGAENDNINENIDSVPHMTFDEALTEFPSCLYISCADTHGCRDLWNRKLRDNGVLSKESGLLFWRYAFLLDTGISIEEDESISVERIRSNACNKLLLFNHMIHSGSGYFQQLIDGNENILSIPWMTSTWLKIYDNRLCKLTGKKLWIEICAQMAKYYDTSVDRNGDFPEDTTLHTANLYYGKQGKFDWDFMISPGQFYAYLSKELSDNRRYSFGELLKAIFSSYANSIGRRLGKDFWIAYDLHDPQTTWFDLNKYGLGEDFEKICNIFIIRNPIQHFNSLMRAYVTGATDDNIRFMLNLDHVKKHLRVDSGYYFQNYNINNTYIIRFEDLKFNRKKVMEAFSLKLNIPISRTLDETTINGKKVYNRKKIGDVYKYVDGNDSFSVDKTTFVNILSKNDVDRLNYLFRNVIRAYYCHEGEEVRIFSRQEMLKPYNFLDSIVDEIIRTGDVWSEAERFKDDIYQEIDDLLTFSNDTMEFYPLLEF